MDTAKGRRGREGREKIYIYVGVFVRVCVCVFFHVLPVQTKLMNDWDNVCPHRQILQFHDEGSKMT